MEAATSGTTRLDGRDAKLLYAATVEFSSAPFRAERLALAYLPAVAKVLDFGARSYSFCRSDEDPDKFVHVSTWDNKVDFEQYWFSRDMQKIRTEIQGMHDLPLLPHWHTVIEHSSFA